MHPTKEKSSFFLSLSPLHNLVMVICHYLGFIICNTMRTDVALSTCSAVANALSRWRIMSTGVIYVV